MSEYRATEDNMESLTVPRTPDRAVKFAFTLEHKFFAELHSRLEDERGRANEQHSSLLKWLKSAIEPPEGYSVAFDTETILHPPEVIPPVEHLSALVQAAFWASLEREEGRALHFKVSFVRPETGGEKLITFDQPLPCDVRALTKLAPAVGATEGALLVAPFEKNLCSKVKANLTARSGVRGTVSDSMLSSVARYSLISGTISWARPVRTSPSRLRHLLSYRASFLLNGRSISVITQCC